MSTSAPEIVVENQTDNEPDPSAALLKNQASANGRLQSSNCLPNARTLSDTMCPKSRFQYVTKRVIDVQRLASLTPEFGPDWSPGDEPGIDISTLDGKFDSILCRCNVTVVDYSQEHVQIRGDLTNASFASFLACRRPPWAEVRWINIDGLSWDVIKPLAINYELHPLAVENLFHIPQRTKVDYYTDHMFISLMLHTLQSETESSPLPLSMAEPLVSTPLHSSTSSQSGVRGESYTNSKYYKSMNEFRKYGVHVALEQTFLFMITEGKHVNTLITFFQHSGRPVTDPVKERLRQRKTLLRSSADVSMLMQAVLDAIVDHALPIADSYREQIAELEEKILLGPMMSHTRELHLITGELTLLKRTLAPIQGLIHTLRGHGEHNPVSSLACTYFGDVLDHCNTTVENLDMMIAVSENLINLVFNTIAYETNESMKKLSYISMIFLPITFLAGVYGMNFENFPELKRDVSYFWELCAFLLVIMLFLFTVSFWKRLLIQAWQWMKQKIWWNGRMTNGAGNHCESRGTQKWGKAGIARG